MILPGCALSLVLASTAGLPPVADPPHAGGGDPRLQALASVHDGRFERARETLGNPDADPTDPGIPFFLAYVDYWHLIYDPDDRTVQARFEANLLRTLELAERLPPERSLDAGTWAGTAHLLLAQLRAWEGRSVAAALEAGRSKRGLERVVRQDASRADPLFALGTYNYLADRVPAFVKGLRALLFLPGGDQRLGLRQLERAAAESRYFRLDARLLLATFHSHRKERRYDDARREIERAVRDFGGRVAVRHAAARLDLAMARPESAADHLDRALAAAARPPVADPPVRATLELMRARTDLAMFRPDLGAERLTALLASSSDLPASVRADAISLHAEARSILGTPAWERIRETVATAVAGARSFEVVPAVRLAEEHPSDAAAALVAGRALLSASAPEEALMWLQRAEAGASSLPPSWVGPCRLMAAQALDLQGRRDEALAFYRRAVESAPFPGRDAARYWQSTPYRVGA